MAKQNSEKYAAGKLPKLWDFLVELHKTNPAAFDVDGNYLKEIVSQRWSALHDQTKCPNCKANMTMYKRKIDYHLVVLLQSLGRVVRERLAEHSLTEANCVHINSESRIPHNSRCVTGIASALGLIAPVKGKEAHWCITKRGFAGLRNEPIQAWAIVFRDEVLERAEETVTFSEVMQGRKEGHDPQEWYEIAGLAEGEMLD